MRCKDKYFSRLFPVLDKKFCKSGTNFSKHNAAKNALIVLITNRKILKIRQNPIKEFFPFLCSQRVHILLIDNQSVRSYLYVFFPSFSRFTQKSTEKRVSLFGAGALEIFLIGNGANLVKIIDSTAFFFPKFHRV